MTVSHRPEVKAQKPVAKKRSGDAGSKSAPALADLDADGRSGVRGFHLATTYVPPRR